jgi:hypothetical protein
LIVSDALYREGVVNELNPTVLLVGGAWGEEHVKSLLAEILNFRQEFFSNAKQFWHRTVRLCLARNRVEQ